MAEAVKCPKEGCGGMVGRIKINPRSKQRVGQCLKCGKLVNLGKAEGSEKPTAKEKIKPAAAKGGKQSPAPAAGGPRNKPGQPGPVQPGQRVQRGGWRGALADFFDI